VAAIMLNGINAYSHAVAITVVNAYVVAIGDHVVDAADAATEVDVDVDVNVVVITYADIHTDIDTYC
jgi:hypothetical protein